MPNQFLEYNQIFHALADTTRRAVIERLSQGNASVSDLAAPFEMALPSFMQHLGVLEKSGLVRSTKTGRIRTYALEPKAMQEIEGWLGKQRNIWESRLDQLDEYLLQQKENAQTKN
jgi:DNA-binding transcriptional ArsR family regulator